jgi:hypothetical protein
MPVRESSCAEPKISLTPVGREPIAIPMHPGGGRQCMRYNDDNHDNRHNHDNDMITSGFS